MAGEDGVKDEEDEEEEEEQEEEEEELLEEVVEGDDMILVDTFEKNEKFSPAT